MGFDVLFGASTELATKVANNGVKAFKVLTPTVKKQTQRGCEHCTLNKVDGVEKLFTKVRSRSIMVFAESPTHDENHSGIALSNAGAEFFWEECERVGIKRKDVDVQYVVRCFPAQLTEGSYDSYLKRRPASAIEIRCCSQYTDEALVAGKPNQILVLGTVAAKALLKTRSLPTDKVFWSAELNAKIYLLDHPTMFTSGYGTDAKLKHFRQLLGMVKQDSESGTADLADNFAFFRSQDYRLVLNKADADEAITVLRKYGKRGRRLTVDIEDAPVSGKKSKQVITAVGLSPKVGMAFVFILGHPAQSETESRRLVQVLKGVLEDPKIEKALHYGCTDVTKLEKLLGITVQGFTHDTFISEYFRDPDKKKYGLEDIGNTRYPEFTASKALGYGDFLAASAEPVPEKVLAGAHNVQKAYIKRFALFDTSKLSLDTMRLYNGADCDLTKRIEISNKTAAPQALMKLYIDLTFVLLAMEANGPTFDYQQNAKLAVVYQYREEKALRELREAVGKVPLGKKDKLKWVDYNPGSTTQNDWVLYKKFKLDYPFDGKRNATKKTLLTLGLEHPFPNKLIAWRKAAKGRSTYVVGYKVCADLNGGKLRTSWRATGTRTGRLSSGGDRGKVKNKVNLQNVHGDSQMKNMLVADRRWRRAYNKIYKICRSYKEFWQYTFEYFPKVTDDNKKAKRAGTPLTPVIPMTELQKHQKAMVFMRIERWLHTHMPDLKTYLVCDYGQVEVRVAAQLSGDKNLLADCKQSDIHTAVGVTMTGWDPELIKNDEGVRRLTKNVHFGILFGISRENLYDFVVAMTKPEEQGSVTRESVYAAYDRYFARYKGIKRFIDAQRAFAQEHSYCETLFGLRQPLDLTDNKRNSADEDADEDYFDIGSGSVTKRKAYWGNQTINNPVQGTAHQWMICALVNLIRQARKYALLGTPTMEVHDALYNVVRVLDLLDAYKMARYLLEKEALVTVNSDFPHIDWQVPIVTDAKAGLRLGTTVEITEQTTVGSFMVDWFLKCRKQVKELNNELSEIQKNPLPIAV